MKILETMIGLREIRSARFNVPDVAVKQVEREHHLRLVYVTWDRRTMWLHFSDEEDA